MSAHYNGWHGKDDTNGGRMTWLVYVHLSNNARLDRAMSDMARHEWERARRQVETFTDCVYRLANKMESAVDEMMTGYNGNGAVDLMRRDILITALSFADFTEIARAYLESYRNETGDDSND